MCTGGRCNLQSKVRLAVSAVLSSVPRRVLRDAFLLCATGTRGFSLAPVRLLLVDDDESVLSGLSVLLEAHEFEVTTAANVSDALKHIASASFDVLLSDLHMPGAGDGLIVVGAMRHANPRAVTLVLSPTPDRAKAPRAILRMVDEVLLKPAKAGPIVETIRRRLAEEEAFPRPREIEDEPLRPQAVELVASLLERERAAITQAWLAKMNEAGGMGRRWE